MTLSRLFLPVLLTALATWGIFYGTIKQSTLSTVQICEHAQAHPEDEAFALAQCIGEVKIVRDATLTPEYFSVILPRDLYDATIQKTNPGPGEGKGLLNVVFTRLKR